MACSSERTSTRTRSRSLSRWACWSRNLPAEDVRPFVVPGRGEPLPLLEQPGGIELGEEDPLGVVQRPGEVRTVGPQDRAAAATEHVRVAEELPQREILGVGACALK